MATKVLGKDHTDSTSPLLTWFATLWDGSANKDVELTYLRNLLIGSVNFYSQDAAPSSPVADDLWWETDTNILWTYGTYAGASRWVTADAFSTQLASAGSARAAAAYVVMNTPTFAGYDIYIETFFVRSFVITTNTGVNYWIYTLRKCSGSTPPSSGGGTSLATFNTSAKSPDAWFDLSVAVDAVIDGTGAGIEVVFVNGTLNGTPGSAWDNSGFSYRLVHP